MTRDRSVSRPLGGITLFLVISCAVAIAASDEQWLPRDTVKRYARAAGIDDGDHSYDIVYPRISNRWKREGAVSDDDVEDHLTVEAFGDTLNLRLKRSDDFFVTPFVEYCGDGGIVWDKFPVDVDKSCYHSGYITGVENSLVAITVCEGYDVTGWLVGNYTLFLHPIQNGDIPARRRRDTDDQPHIAFKVHGDPTDDFVNDFVFPPNADIEDELELAQANRERDLGGALRPIYVELMVAVDKTAQEKLGKNTVPHILAMVNLVATAYKHPTTEEMDINIRLVRLILVDEDKCKPFLDVSQDVYERLSLFKSWANAINVEDDDDPLHFDYAFFFTNKDWVNSGVGGLAYVGGMCTSYSAGLCGISTYVSCFGHEMGHTLGLSHDSSQCPDSEENGFMAGGYYKLTECNRQQLRGYMTSYNKPSSCLYDKPICQTTWPWPEYYNGERVESGKVFSPDVECKAYYYGKSTGQCPWKTLEVLDYQDGDTCYLYCQMSSGECKYWGKAIEGTPCGPGKACLADVCTCLNKADCSSSEGVGTVPKNTSYVPSVFSADRDTAVQICDSQQGSLAKILNKDTLDHLIDMLEEFGLRDSFNFHFDGRRYPRQENDWRTVDGEVLTYFDWESGEPNNAGGHQECLVLWEEIMQFSDYTCSSSSHYICQKDGKGECYTERLANDYRGRKNTTKKGHTCLKWTEHSHGKTPTAYPNRGLGDHNYCRNPDVDSGGAWCYVSGGSQHYDYCDVGQPKESCGGKGECFQDKNGYDYRGTVSTTVNGYTCQNWTSQTPRSHSNTPEAVPNAGLGDHNYCRNPDNEPSAWCYTVDGPRFDFCDVGNPGDCERLGQNLQGKMVTLGETSLLASTKPFSSSISEITVSLWVRSSGSDSSELFIYSSPFVEDDFSVRDIGNMKMYVRGVGAQASDVGANDGFWHHVAVTWDSADGGWQIFKDGVLLSAGADLEREYQIQRGGMLVVGRGQDAPGDAWSSGYIEGEMTNFNVWNRKLTTVEIENLAKTCAGSLTLTGNVISWGGDDLSVQLSAPGRLPIEQADTCEPVLSGLDGKMIQFDGVYTVESFVTISRLTQLTACFWLQTDQTGGGWFTYETQDEYVLAFWFDTELMVQPGVWNGVPIAVNDGQWHHVCVTWRSAGGEWQVFKDGALASSGVGLGDGFELGAGGNFLLGASRWYKVRGNMASFNVWDHVLPDQEVEKVKESCGDSYEGNVLSWKQGLKPPPSEYIADVDICAL